MRIGVPAAMGTADVTITATEKGFSRSPLSHSRKKGWFRLRLGPAAVRLRRAGSDSLHSQTCRSGRRSRPKGRDR